MQAALLIEANKQPHNTKDSLKVVIAESMTNSCYDCLIGECSSSRGQVLLITVADSGFVE